MKLRSGKIINYNTTPIDRSVTKTKKCITQNMVVNHPQQNTSFIKEIITFCMLSSSVLLLSNLFDFKQFFKNISIEDIHFSLFSDI